MRAIYLFPTLRQFTDGWTLDLVSSLLGLVAGLILGVLLLLAFKRLLPRLRRMRRQSAARFQETRAWVRAGVEKRFQAETAAYVRRYHLGRRWAALDEIFVEPALLAPFTGEPEEPEGQATAPLIYLWPRLATAVAIPPPPTRSVHELLRDGRRVILSAPAGWGKSTLLAWCAYLCTQAAEEGPYHYLLPFLPVFIHLAELELPPPGAAERDGEDSNPVDPLARALQARLGPLTGPGVDALLRKKLAAGDVLLLVDGWDELDSAGHARPATWLALLLEQFPEIRVFVAAAVDGYQALRDLGFTLSGLAPWRPAHAAHLGRAWATAGDWARPPAARQYWQPGRTPLGTTLALWLGEEGPLAAEEVPRAEATEVELLSAAFDRFLPRSAERAWLPVAARQLWQRLAYEMVARGRLALPDATAQGLVEEAVAPYLEKVPTAVRQRLLPEDGLFVRWPGERLGFLSPLWRDFLAAGYLADEKMIEVVQENVARPGWADIVRFFVARAGEGDLAQARLDPRSTDPLREDLFQVAGWLHEAQGEGEWRRQVLIQLGQMVVRPQTPAILRQRAVAAIARSGDPGVVALLRQLLQRSEPAIRQAAIAALAPISPATSVPLLERMLKDEDVAVRVAAVHALGRQYSTLSEKGLLTALIGRDEAMSRAAAVQLALMGEDGWEILREAATDEDLRVRRSAAQGLVLLDEPWARRLLQKLKGDGEWAVRSAATASLEIMAERDRETPWRPRQAGDLEWLLQWATRHRRPLAAGSGALPNLLEALSVDRAPEVRAAAAQSLAYVYIPPAQRAAVLEALRAAARDEAASVRNAAVASLAHLYRAAPGSALS